MVLGKQPAKILYIEDHLPSLRLVQRILTVSGYVALGATSGEEGLAIAARECPDLILTDINLPDISGLEVAARLKQSPDLAAIPVVAITANTLYGDRERALTSGCDAFLGKPLVRHELLTTIARLLDKAAGEGTDAAR